MIPVRQLALVLLTCSSLLAGAQQIALTFDDLPTHGDLPPNTTRLEVADCILHTLKEQRLPPVYGMVNGLRTETDPATLDVLKSWRAAGEPLGNHSWSHMNLNQHTADEFTADIARNEPLLASLMPGADWHWFRYPFLWEGDTLPKRRAVRTYLASHGYRIAQVTMDFEDYLWNDPYARCVARADTRSIAWLETTYLDTAGQYLTLYRGIAQTLYGHDIPYVLLLHIGAFDAHMLPRLIGLYRSHGFSFVTLAAAEADPTYAEDPDLALKFGGALTEQVMAKRNLKIPPNSKPYAQLEAVCRK